jgi:pantetheine-phosphate adenylyltransferase
VAVDTGKSAMFSLEERMEIAREVTDHLKDQVEIVVHGYSGLTIKVARELGAQLLVRGLRAFSDFENEFQLTSMNRQMDREIETVFLMSDPQHQAVASRMVKEIVTLGGDVTPFVPAAVKRRLMVKAGRA